MAMRRDRALWRILGTGGLTASLLVVAAAAGTGGCDGDGPGGAGGTGGGGSGGGAPLDPVKAACIGDFRVGKAPGGKCPSPEQESGWIAAADLLGPDGYN